MKGALKSKKTIIIVLLIIFIMPIFSSSSMPQTRIDIQEDFTLADFEIGSVVYTEHGSKTYLGSDRWQYRSSIGEANTWNGTHWVRWIYNNAEKSVKVGNLTISHNPNGALTITGDSGIIVGRLSWYSQYYAGAQWNNVTLDNYAWRGFSVNETHAHAYQQFWGNTGELNVTYIYSPSQEFKILVDITNNAAQSVPVRIIWGASRIKNAIGNYELLRDIVDGRNVTVGIDIDGTKFFWQDVRTIDPNIAVNTVLDKPNRRAAVVFGNQSSVLPAGYTYTLDPTFSDDIAADGDDDYWTDPNGSPTHYTSGTAIWFANDTIAGWKHRGQVRFSLPIPQGSTIDSADFTGYETYDTANQYDHVLWRIDEANVGSLEGDSSIPSVDKSIVAEWESDGSNGEWCPLINVTDIVQAQVDLGGWDEDYYIGFAFESLQTSFSNEAFQDYQAAGTNHANVSIEWTEEAAGDDYYVTVNDVISLSDSTSTVLDGAVTIAESILLSDSISTTWQTSITVLEVIQLFESVHAEIGQAGVVVIYEIIPIDDSTSTAVAFLETILEIIPFFDSVRLEINPVDVLIIYVIIPIAISEVIEGGLDGLNIFYDIFLSASMWSYLGPIALVIIGYFLVKKEVVLGVLWFIVECLFIGQYMELVAAHPPYWWHIFILLFGGLATCVYPLWDR